MKDGKLQWHTAFSAAMHIEFREEMEKLRFEEEHILGKKPMQIDLLIIKMRTEEKIRKNIGKIFREHNIIEYKSPEDYLSINDFYKVYGYACFYQAVADVVFRANWKTMEEEKKMCDALRELFAEELKESKEEGISVGMTRGISQGILKGILVLLDTYQEMNLSEEEAERRITEKFSLSEEKAREYMEKYWGR